MQSQFNSHDLAEVYRDLYLGEASGVLHLARGDLEKRIHFDRGMILYAESPETEEDLGDCLVRDGKLSSGALAESRNIATARRASAPSRARSGGHPG